MSSSAIATSCARICGTPNQQTKPNPSGRLCYFCPHRPNLENNNRKLAKRATRNTDRGVRVWGGREYLLHELHLLLHHLLRRCRRPCRRRRHLRPRFDEKTLPSPERHAWRWSTAATTQRETMLRPIQSTSSNMGGPFKKKERPDRTAQAQLLGFYGPRLGADSPLRMLPYYRSRGLAAPSIPARRRQSAVRGRRGLLPV